MAAIIAQLTLANRRRKKRGKYFLAAEKSNYALPPFDTRYDPDKHNRYLINKKVYEYRKSITDTAKGSNQA